MSENPVVLGGRYELGRVLGHGGMAEVFLATDTRLHRTVAVKVLRSDLARDDSFQERFRREAQSAAGLNHPAIVAVYDTGEDRRTEAHGHEITIPYIVMEYVEGRTLRAFIHDDHPMDIRQAGEIMAGVLSALEYSHSRGIVHRDIKPGNVMITDDGAVKVMDFGIARAVADATSAMTQTQAVMGTAQYLSPEQARGQIVDSRSDIYSAACVLYELVTGRAPFTGDSPVSIAYQHVREAPVPPSTYNPQLTPAMDDVILLGLAKDRDERYPSAVAFSRDIAAVVAGRPPRLSAIAGMSPSPTRPDSDGEATTVLAPYSADATQVLPGAAANPGAASPPVASPAPAVLGSSSPAPAPVETEERKRPVWLFVLLAVAGAAIVGALLLLLRPWDTGPDTVAVPAVVSQTQDEARARLSDAGLTPKVSQEASSDVEKGRVIRTDPEAGTQVAPGSEVAVVVSSGPGSVEIPDLTGMSVDEARSALEGQGLTLQVAGTEDSTEVEKDQITRSDPPAGATRNEGDAVQVWTASGNVPVPNVVGQSEDDATATLEEAGFEVRSTDAEGSDQKPGTVTEQSPKADAGSAPAGSTVQIVVAREAGPVTVPNLTGRTPEEARTALTQLGLGVKSGTEHSADVPSGAVVRTDPAANSTVEAGSTVTVIVSDGPEPAPSPTPSSQAPPAPSPTSSAPSSPAPSSPAPGTGTQRGNGNGNSGNGNG